ncbi:MAG TPA: J domain-containing protein [Candidatus Tectomicrobia bacterium]
MEFKDYYAVLGVGKEATQAEIQRAYRKLARQYHPDVNKAKGAEEKFKELGEAYEVLKDPEKRARYDRYGVAWKAAQQGGGTPPPGYEDVWFDLGGVPDDFGFSGFSSFFEQLFGTGSQQGPRRRRPGASPPGWQWATPGEDQEARLPLTLEEAANGGQREISLTDPSTGQSRTYVVHIPKGIRPGQRIRLAGRGGKGSGSVPAGDLYLHVDILPHAAFRLEGKDLYTTLPVTPWEAALGTEVTLQTLDGAVHVKIPQGSSSGRKIRLRGKGFPDTRGEAGNLYAEIRIVVPERLSAQEKQLFEELARVSHFTPRPSGRGSRA